MVKLKTSTDRLWEGGKSINFDHGGWNPKSPSSIRFNKDSLIPEELSVNDQQMLYLCREYLRNSYLALNAERNKNSWPLQYQRSID